MRQPKISEREITHSIKSLLSQFGIWHFKHFGGLYAPKGIPDIIGILPDKHTKKGVFFGLEIKVIGGHTSPDQDRVLQNIREAGGIAGVVHNVNEVVELLDLKIGMLF
jgi:hypothetical protein